MLSSLYSPAPLGGEPTPEGDSDGFEPPPVGGSGVVMNRSIAL
jgi:hypothetical protein